MKLTDLKKNLMNIISANELLKESNRIANSSEHQLLPLLEKFKETFDGKLVATESKVMMGKLERFAKSIDANKPFSYMYRAVEVIAKEANKLEKLLDSSNFEAIMRESMNIRDGHIIQFIAFADHTLDIIRSICVVVQEFEVYNMRKMPLEKHQLRYIENNLNDDNLRDIAQLIQFFASKHDDNIISKIYDLPDIKVDENIIKTIESLEGPSKVDPAGFNPLNLINPLYYIFNVQKAWSEIKFYRIEMAAEELQYCEHRLLELKMLREGNNNPQLERKVERYQDRIQTLRSKISRIKATMG